MWSPTTFTKNRDRLLDGEPLTHDSGDDLQDRAREPHRPCAPDHEARRALVEHERRGHHARQAGAGIAVLRPDHVELAEHVVELEAVAEDT